jgi:hypothetical protein
MSNNDKYDLTYITIDSLSEGVGSSQITPLITRLGKSGMKINLISFEKFKPESQLQDFFESIGVVWNSRPFGSSGVLGGISRLNNLRLAIPKTDLIHARSDIPAVSAIISHQAPVLWDVRSLWADQKIMIQKNILNKALYDSYRKLERISAHKSLGMSTLTSAVVPILEMRNRRLPTMRTVVPTAVDLERFSLTSKMPNVLRALFSGTYNDYYDLELSSLFMEELRQQIRVETHWARPFESSRQFIGVGEEKVFFAPQTEIAKLIPNYSFGVSICKLTAGPSLSAAMPTKIGEFLACGRPVVVNRGLGDMDEFIAESKVGVALSGDPGNARHAAGELIELISDPETPFRCRATAEKYFSMDNGVEKYLELYGRMLSS